MRMTIYLIIVMFVVGFNSCPNFSIGLRNKAANIETSSSCYSLITSADRYLNNDDWQQAIEHYDSAIKLDPSSIYAYEGRGEAHLMVLDFHAAMKDYSEIVKREPKNAEGHAGLAIALEKLGNYRGAFIEYDSALRLDNSDVISLHNRAVLRKKLGDTEGSEKDSRRSREIGNLPMLEPLYE